MADEIFDPFRREVKLQRESLYYPLGFPLMLATNSQEVQQVADEVWSDYPQAFLSPPLRVRVLVEPDGAHPPAPVYRGREHLMTIAADARNFAVCDHTRNSAFCWLTAETVRDRAFTGYYFLEAIANYSLTQLYLAPVHGACIAKGGRGVLLCGASGAGKTSLAYFCARNGWTYVSDNESWLVRAEGGRVLIGNPHRIRFRDSARDLFPELAGLDPAPDFNGKMSIAVAPSGIDTAYRCCVERVVLLARRPEGPATLSGFPPEKALDRFLSELPLYDREIRADQQDCLRTVAGLNPVELRYSSFSDAMPLLESLLI